MIAGFLQERAGQTPLDRGSVTFVADVFLVLKSVFVKLRTEVGARALSDVKEYVVGEQARELLAMFSQVPSMRSVFETFQSREFGWGARQSHPDGKKTGLIFLKAATWNISGGQRSAQSPASWLLAD